GRLRLAFGTVTVLTLGLGAISFGMIEEMHVKTHRVQLRVEWQRQLGVARAALDEDLTQQLVDGASLDLAVREAHEQTVERILQTLGSTAQYPGLSARPEDVTTTLDQYRGAYDRAVTAYQTYREALPDAAQQGRLVDSIAALGALQRLVDDD